MQARMLQSGGLHFKFVDSYDGTDVEKEAVDRKILREVKQFMKDSWYYPIHASKNFYKLINVFPQLQLQGDRKKIRKLFVREAAMCRLGLQDNAGRINNCYVNACWPDARYDDKETIKLDLLDSIFDSPDEIKDREELDYIYQLSYPTGKTYYQLADWNGIVKSWLPLLNSIPEFKKAVMENQITVKYHIEFPDYYWTSKFGDEYDNWNVKKQAKKRKEEFDKMNKFLKGIENSGKSIATTYKTHPDHAKEFPGVKFTEIGEKYRKEGLYLEDATDATIKLYSALGFDHSIFGINSGSGQNRAGSDKREAFDIHQSTLTAHSDILLKPHEFISEYNGWNGENFEVKWYFLKPHLQTLNEVTPSKRRNIIPEEDADK
jgi:hypothetical protein